MDRSKFIGLPWADPSDPTQATYPAGSDDWSGGPTRLPTLNRFWTPGPSNAPTAEEFNGVVGGRDDALLALLGATGAIDALNWGDLTNWGPALNSATDVMAMAPAWHAKLGVWLVAYNTGSALKCAASPDGKAWFLFGTSTFTNLPDDISINPSSGTGLAIGNGSLKALAAGSTTWGAAGSWSPTPGGFSSAPNTTATTFFGGVHVIATAGPTVLGGSIRCAWSPDGATSFTNYSGTLFTSGTSGAGFQILAQSAGRLLIMNQSDGPNYAYSSDGKAFTQGTLPTLLTGEQVQGVTCDTSTSTFYLLLSKSGASRIFASADGITWTLVSSPAKTMWQLAANGGTLLSLLSDGVWGNHLVVSTDGGATWRYAGLGCHSVPLNGLIVQLAGSARLRGNGSQFIVSDQAQVTYAASKILGPGTLVG